MSEYHCLVAGLPDIAFDGSKQLYTVDKFREDVCPYLSHDDAACINLFFLAKDNENILTLLAKGSEAELAAVGCYTKNELLDIIEAVKAGDARDSKVPSYIYDFLEFYWEKEEQGGYLWADVLSTQYYAYATSVKNKFLSAWFTFNLDVNNLIVAMLARKYKLNVADAVIGDNEVAEALRTSSSRDFGLSGSFEYLEAVQKLCENDRLQEREHQLDEMRWKWLDDNSVFNYFTVEKLYVFLQKLDIVSRWVGLDIEKGMQCYTEIINDLKGVLRNDSNFAK